MSDKPRTWSLVGTDSPRPGELPEDLPTVEAGPVMHEEDVVVVELEPVLDLVRDLFDVGFAGRDLHERTEALLREHGRLEET